MPDDVLFVYGSLRSSCDNPHARLLRENAELLGSATVRGSVFLIGTFPGYRREPDGVVHGELWCLRDPERTFAVLDDYEGCEYSRVQTGGQGDYQGRDFSRVRSGALDVYEGSDYSPVLTNALDDYQEPECAACAGVRAGGAWIYLYIGDLSGCSQILSGDFLAP